MKNNKKMDITLEKKKTWDSMSQVTVNQNKSQSTKCRPCCRT